VLRQDDDEDDESGTRVMFMLVIFDEIVILGLSTRKIVTSP
jgi:hypothetical protein